MPCPRGKDLSPQTRSRICELKAYGLSYKQIHAVHHNIPLSTIKSTVLLERKRNDNQSQPRSGCPWKLTEEQRDHLYDLSVHKPHIRIRDMLSEVDHAVKERSIHGLLNEMGRRKWKQLQRPEIHEIHAQKRLAWANQYKDFLPQDWATVRWSDECTVERGHGVQTVWTFRRPSEQLQERDVATHRTGKAVKQMFWAAFGEDFLQVLFLWMEIQVHHKGG